MSTAPDLQALSKSFMDTANRLPTMFDLSEEWNGLIDRLEDPEADPEEIERELDRIAGDIRRKGFGLAVVIQALEDLADVQKKHVERLTEKRKANQAHAQRLRDYAYHCMKAMGTDRIDAGVFKFAIQKNPPKAVVVDEEAVPAEFKEVRQSVHIDLNGIKAHVKATGEMVPGVVIERGEGLRLS